MQRLTKGLTLCAVVAGLALTGCGGAGTPSSSATTEAVKAAAKEMSPPDGRSEEERVNEFEGLLVQLRSVPQLAPLFDMYHVPSPITFEDDEAEEEGGGLVALLHAVRITVASGTVTITNRETGGVIFTAPMADLASGVFHPENLPSGSGACTYTYSAWSMCDPATLTQTRTIVSATPAGCTGTPVLSQSCTVGAPPPVTCTSFTYSAWGACQMDNTQTRTVLTSSPAGCTGGSPVTTQACVYAAPTCTSFTYSAWGTCQPNNTQTRTVLTSSPAGCTGGSPVTTQACVYTAPTCTSFTYSAWGACQPNNTQTRTVLTSSPAGCTGGSPVTTQACVYTPPIDGAALYGQYCSGCHGPLATSNLKGKSISLSLIKSFNMTQGLTDAQLSAIVTAIGP